MNMIAPKPAIKWHDRMRETIVQSSYAGVLPKKCAVEQVARIAVGRVLHGEWSSFAAIDLHGEEVQCAFAADDVPISSGALQCAGGRVERGVCWLRFENA